MYVVQFMNGSGWSRLTASGNMASACRMADRYAERYDAVRVVDEDGMVVYCA